jgi:predicted nucleic acid-binding Zn ribbon protein
MDGDQTVEFECAACGATMPVLAVRYDDLGYPECPACTARTGPLASVETEESAGSVAN